VVDDSLLGDVAVFTVVFVSVFSVVAGEADGFTTVVLFSVLLSAGGLVVSDFCSQAANNAAPASMQMYFFIVYGGLMWVNQIFGASKLFRPCVNWPRIFRGGLEAPKACPCTASTAVIDRCYRRRFAVIKTPA
jgi:hypothetical protein